MCHYSCKPSPLKPATSPFTSANSSVNPFQTPNKSPELKPTPKYPLGAKHVTPKTQHQEASKQQRPTSQQTHALPPQAHITAHVKLCAATTVGGNLTCPIRKTDRSPRVTISVLQKQFPTSASQGDLASVCKTQCMYVLCSSTVYLTHVVPAKHSDSATDPSRIVGMGCEGCGSWIFCVRVCPRRDSAGTVAWGIVGARLVCGLDVGRG